MKSFMAKAHSSAKCPATNGRNSPICGCSSAYMYAQPGKKLLFMGCEFGQVREWAHDISLEWHVLQYPVHRGVQAWMEQLNRSIAANLPCMNSITIQEAFEWVDCNDTGASMISLLRKAKNAARHRSRGLQLHPVPREDIASACPMADSGGRCSTVMLANMRAAEWEISAARTQKRYRRMGGRTRWP